ncbi:MAG TPA: hypothetical protein VLL48_00330, partial [Longimicrobiales bacterium]|nr:hypothetical protein [Longimicrobiales bacterium]
NARRAARNVRKVVMGFVFRSSLEGEEPGAVRSPELATRVVDTLPEARTAPERVEEALHELAAEFDADVDTDPAGTLEFRFPGVRRQFAAAAETRKALALEALEVGEIVYSSADDAEEAYERDLDAFDRELAAGAPDVPRLEEEGAEADDATPALPPGESEDLSRYVEAPDRIGYVEDWELVAFEERMNRRREKVRVGRR